MADVDRTPQPLSSNFKIVDENGFPNDYFIRWCEERQIAIQDGITAAQAQLLIDEWAAGRSINTTAPITGGGTLDADLTIEHAPSGVTADTYGDSTHVPQITVDEFGHVTDVVEVAISGGGGGGGGPSGPYRYFMWNNIIHGADAASLGAAKFRDAGGVAIADPTPSSNYNSYPPTNLFDGSAGSFWSTYGGQADGNAVAVMFDFGTPVTIGSIDMTSRDDGGYATQTPIQMGWWCSEDGQIWLQICTINVWPDLVTTPFVGASSLVNVPVLAT